MTVRLILFNYFEQGKNYKFSALISSVIYGFGVLNLFFLWFAIMNSKQRLSTSLEKKAPVSFNIVL